MYHDVIVVGAGPGGCMASKVLSDAGFKVLLLERERIPREKVCGGLLSPEAVGLIEENFGPLPEECLAYPGLARGARLICEGGGEYELPFSGRGKRVLRSRLDAWMTAKSGAEVIDGREVDGVSAQRFNVQISVRNNEGSELFESTYLVGADGADSMVLAGLRPGFHRLYALPHLERTALILSEGELDWDAEWTGLILLRHGKGIGRLMVDEQFIRLAVNYDSRRGWQDELAGMTSYLGERFGLRLRGDIVHRISASNRMGVGGNYNLGAGFALLVGEAAGLLDPWGFGIKLALDSGRIAAESLVESAGESITPHIRYRYRMHETLDGLIRQRRKLGDRVGDLETASLSSREGDRVTKRDRRRLRRRFLK